MQVGLAAEQDQADTVTLAGFEEVAEQGLDQGQTADFFVLPVHVGKVHGAGDIHRHQQVAAAGGHRHRLAQPLRAGGGQ
ncbi:hypothetical protein D3C84_942400 [compost metagenome]